MSWSSYHRESRWAGWKRFLKRFWEFTWKGGLTLLVPILLAIGWYAYQARTNEAPGFPLRTGFNGLEVDPWVDQELMTKMAAGGFVAPELDPNAANAAQAEGGEGNGN